MYINPRPRITGCLLNKNVNVHRFAPRGEISKREREREIKEGKKEIEFQGVYKTRTKTSVDLHQEGNFWREGERERGHEGRKNHEEKGQPI